MSLNRIPTDLAFGLVTAYLQEDEAAATVMVRALQDEHDEVGYLGAIGALTALVAHLIGGLAEATHEQPTDMWSQVAGHLAVVLDGVSLYDDGRPV